MSQPTIVVQRPVETVVKETIIEDLVIDVTIERPTVSGGIDALGLKPTQLEPIQPTFVTPVNETIVEAPRPVTYVTQMAAPLTNTLNRSFQSVPATAYGAPMGSFATMGMAPATMSRVY